MQLTACLVRFDPLRPRYVRFRLTVASPGVEFSSHAQIEIWICPSGHFATFRKSIRRSLVCSRGLRRGLDTWHFIPMVVYYSGVRRLLFAMGRWRCQIEGGRGESRKDNSTNNYKDYIWQHLASLKCVNGWLWAENKCQYRNWNATTVRFWQNGSRTKIAVFQRT